MCRKHRALKLHPGCFGRSDPAVTANMSGWVGYRDVIRILSAAIVSGLAIRTVGRKSPGGPPAETDSEEASLQPAGGEAVSAAICHRLASK
jgi:hypothetical protein